MFATLLAAMWLDEPLTRAKLAGMACGVAGVALVSKAGPVVPDAMFGWAIAASLGAAFCYAAAGIYLRKRASDAPAMAVAGWSQLAAAAVLMPIVFAARWCHLGRGGAFRQSLATCWRSDWCAAASPIFSITA